MIDLQRGESYTDDISENQKYFLFFLLFRQRITTISRAKWRYNQYPQTSVTIEIPNISITYIYRVSITPLCSISLRILASNSNLFTIVAFNIFGVCISISNAEDIIWFCLSGLFSISIKKSKPCIEFEQYLII